MRTRLAQAGLVAALIVAALLLRGRRPGALEEAGNTPEAAIDALFDAASRGDDAAYLRLTTGPLRSSLESTRSQMGADAFRQSLRRSTTGLKGMCKMRAAGPAGDDTAALDVELCFADHKERQRVSLSSQGQEWLIAKLGTAEIIRTEIAYGTPVFDAPPPDAKPPAGPAAPPPSKPARGTDEPPE